MGGLFSALTKTWSDGYQFGDILKTVGYDLNPFAWGLNKLNDKMFGTNNFEAEHGGPDAISEGIVNTWNKMTGNAHLTPEYQHAEEREDSVNQRTAQDMMAAGLSKFGFGGTPAGTSNASNGLTLLDGIMKAQQIKSNVMALKEQAYNYGLSKKLNIRTGDKNALAPFLALASMMGIDTDDVQNIIPSIFSKLKEIVDEFRGGSSSGDTGTSSGTGSDAGALSDVMTMFGAPVGQYTNPFQSPTSMFNFSSSVPRTGDVPSVTPEMVSTSPELALMNKSLQIHHDSLYDELSGYAVGQAKPLDVSRFLDKYVNELKKEGFEEDHARGFVKSWIDSIMYDLGYSFDRKDGLWFYDH